LADWCRHPVLFIIGSTGTGKSRLALELAEELKLPIVNSDSVQVYQRVNIGTAKPTAEEMDRVPHYLYDKVAPPHRFTAGDYRSRALEVLAELNPQGPVVVVGGSGFYIQALQKGMYPVPKVSAGVVQQLNRELQSQGSQVLYEELRLKDLEFAKTISANDAYRIIRALSLIRSHNKTMSEVQAQFRDNHSSRFPYPYCHLMLNMNRDHLRIKVRARVVKMIKAGLVEEVKALMDEGLSGWGPMQSVGYKQTQAFIQTAHLRGEFAEAELVEEITQQTMRLAKAQLTWFRRYPGVQPFDAETEWDQAREYGRSFLLRCKSNDLI